MFRSSQLIHNFWLKLLSLALAIMIWFTISIAVQHEQRIVLPSAPATENPTNAPSKNPNEQR